MRVKEAEGAEIASTPRPAGRKEADAREAKKQKEAEARERRSRRTLEMCEHH
jgi:hypothetical protein